MQSGTTKRIRYIQFATGAGLVILALIATVSYLQLGRFEISSRPAAYNPDLRIPGTVLIEPTILTLNATDKILALLSEETHAAFAPSAQPLDVIRHVARQEEIRGLTDWLSGRLNDNAIQLEQYNKLRHEMTQLLNTTTTALSLRQQSGHTTPALAALADTAHVNMQAILQATHALKQEELIYLDQRAVQRRNAATQAIRIILFGSIGVALMLIFTYLILTHEIRKRTSVEHTLRNYINEVEDLYNNASCGYHSVDENGIIIRMNDTELSWLGYTREDVIGKLHHSAIYAPEEAAKISASFDKFKKYGVQIDSEYQLLRKNGSTLYVSLSATAVYDADGRFLRSRTSLFDISDRKRFERKLKESNQFLDSIIDNIPYLVFVKDLSRQQYIRFNRAGLKLFNLTTEEVLGKNEYHFFTKAAADELIASERRMIAACSPIDLPAEQIDTGANGIRIMHTKKLPIFDHTGRPQYLLCLSEDVTERIKFERELMESNQFLDSVIENIPNMVFVKNVENLKFVRFNRAGKELFGLEDDSAIIGRSEYDFFPREVADALVASDYQVIQQRALVDVPEETIDTVVNGVRILHTRKLPIFDHEGRPKYILCLSEDVTESIAARNEISTLNANLKREAKELESFSYSVSHDLRAPLRAIIGFTQLFLESHGAALDAEGMRHLTVISNNAKKMGMLIDDLLTFSRLGQQAIKADKLDMTALVRDVWNDLHIAAPQGAPAFELATLSAAVADRALIKQVWLNLLSNAVKYSSKKPQPVIQVSAAVTDTEVIYAVADNGSGFDMKYVDKLFGVFQRLHADDYPGTGVGLAIVQRIVSRHGGRVWAEGIPDQGATFYFSLPLGAIFSERTA